MAATAAYVRARMSTDWQDAPPELRQQMQELFTRQEIEDIEKMARFMEIGNRIGNSADAFSSRLKGQSIKNSSLLSEIVAFMALKLAGPERWRAFSRSSGVRMRDVRQGWKDHVQRFNEQAAAESLAAERS